MYTRQCIQYVKIMRRKKQYTSYLKFNLQYHERLSDSPNLRNIVKSVVVDGKLLPYITFVTISDSTLVNFYNDDATNTK